MWKSKSTTPAKVLSMVGDAAMCFPTAQIGSRRLRRLALALPVLLFAGVFALIVGLAIVLGHNVWSGGAAPAIVTLVGWASLVKGLLILFLPGPGVLTPSKMTPM